MKKILIISICIVLVVVSNVWNVKASISEDKEKIKAAVFFYDEDNDYNIALKNNLIEINERSNGNAELTFYDAKEEQEIQNNQLDEVLREGIDIIFINMVDNNKSADIVNKVKEHNVPLIFFAREPKSFNAIKSYGNSFFIGTDDCELGKVKGEMIINQIKKNKISDRNRNRKLDYILLRGNKESIESKLRSKCVLQRLAKDYKINEVYSGYFNWDKAKVKDYLSPLMLRKVQDIDVIISNNDEMALGAIEVLQEFGYNLDDDKMYIPVFGVDAIPKAKELIKKGVMEGTVIQDPKIMAETIYKVGFNLYNKKNPLDNID